jgi:drug/metabolite transporter (DMT)-like permease
MDTSATDLAQIIQVVVAPVFMLTGIAGFLNVMSGRLGRIVDRARVMERRISLLKNPNILELSQHELKNLWRRVKLINRAIGLCVASALFVCGVVVCLFVGDLWLLNFRNAVIALFTISLILLIFALLTFLKEVQLATRTLQMGKEFIDDETAS